MENELAWEDEREWLEKVYRGPIRLEHVESWLQAEDEEEVPLEEAVPLSEGDLRRAMWRSIDDSDFDAWVRARRDDDIGRELLPIPAVIFLH